MTRGRAIIWTAEVNARIVEAVESRGLRKLAIEMGLAYSTLAEHSRAIGRPVPRPPRVEKFKVRQAVTLRPDLPVVIPAGIKPKIGPSHPWDERYQCDPDSRPFGAGFAAAGVGRDVETGKGWK